MLSNLSTITSADYQFMAFVSEYGKSYGTIAEYQFRSDIFKNALKEIEEHNKSGLHTHSLGINEFSDWTAAEMKVMLGTKPELNTTTQPYTILDDSNLPDSIDWRTKGAVTPVKNQGRCGSCWAFSSTGAIEGTVFMEEKKLYSFSEQELIDCSTKWGNHGCHGGLMDNAFRYLKDHGIEQESDYQYTAKDGSCKYDESKIVTRVSQFHDVARNNLSQVKAALATRPLSVAIEADQPIFQRYKSGVISKGCGNRLDHGVLAVGYGTENGQEYILVKNSWGAAWGDKGYVKIAPDQCGILEVVSYPGSQA